MRSLEYVRLLRVHTLYTYTILMKFTKEIVWDSEIGLVLWEREKWIHRNLNRRQQLLTYFRLALLLLILIMYSCLLTFRWFECDTTCNAYILLIGLVAYAEPEYYI